MHAAPHTRDTPLIPFGEQDESVHYMQFHDNDILDLRYGSSKRWQSAIFQAQDKRSMQMKQIKSRSSIIVTTLMTAALLSSGLSAFAQTGTAETVAPEPNAPAKKAPRKTARHKEQVQFSSSSARHERCLAFIQRHGLSCDPWQQPTCGYDIGYARPMDCVAP